MFKGLDKSADKSSPSLGNESTVGYFTSAYLSCPDTGILQRLCQNCVCSGGQGERGLWRSLFTI